MNNPSTMRIFGISLLLLVVFNSCSFIKEDINLKRPNFIILMADDLGWDDLPLNGNRFVETPGLDKLSEQSVKIKRFYVNPVCAPTRAGLLTGRNFVLTGVSHVHGGKDFINLNEKTFADIFRNEGYRTAVWGKWHSGKTEGYYPWQRGFDEAYMADLYNHNESRGLFNGEYVEHNKWTDEVIVDYALDFIERNQDSVFVAYLSFLTCHAPLVAKEEIISKYVKKGLSANLSKLYAMIEQMDYQILRLLKGIDELGLSENTVIMFMSDNGPAIINNWLSDKDRSIRYSGKYKGHKGNIWENGVKSPLLVSYPEILEPAEVNLLADVTDIFPTMAEFAGIELNDYNLKLTGQSFALNLIEKKYSRSNKFVFNYADPGWPPTEAPWSPKGVKDEYLPVNKIDMINGYNAQILSITDSKYKLLKNPSARENDILDSEGYVLIDMLKDPFEILNLTEIQDEVFFNMSRLLENNFNESINSGHSFSSPVFILGRGIESKVLLYAPADLKGGAKVAFNFSFPWNDADISVNYKIKSQNEFNTLPVISKMGKSSGNIYKIKIGKQETVSIEHSSNEIRFAPIEVPKGEHILNLSVSSAENNDEIRFFELLLNENENIKNL